MKRLALGNTNVGKIGTFKDISPDLLISNPDNQVPSHKKRINPTFLEALAIVRLKNVGKKKAKSQALTKYLNLKHNLIKKTFRVYKILMPLFVAIKLIKFGKQKVKVLVNVVESILSK